MSLGITTKRELTGLDIGSSAVKAAKLKRRGSRYVVTAVVHSPINRSNANPKQLMNRTVAQIRRCLYLIKARNVACAVSGPSVFVHQFDFPWLRSKRIADVVHLETTQVCPFNIEDSATDYQVLSSNGDRSIARWSVKMPKENLHGILAAATNNAVKDKKQLAEIAGARCTVMDVDGLAILNCLTACEGNAKKRTVLVMDVGSTYTNVAILSKEGLPFIRDIPYAADHIIRRICEELELATEAVVETLSGSRENGPDFDTIEPSLTKACSELANEITDTIRYYTAHAPEQAVEKIYLCGGFSQATGFAKVMDSLLLVPLELWNPLRRLPRSYRLRKMHLEKIGPSLVVAIGLAMRLG